MRLLLTACLLLPTALSAEVRTPSRGDVVDLGSTTVGQPVTMEVAISNPFADRPMLIKGLSAEATGYSVQGKPSGLPFEVPPGGSLILQVTLLAETPGLFELSIQAYRDFGPDSQTEALLNFRIAGRVQPPG